MTDKIVMIRYVFLTTFCLWQLGNANAFLSQIDLEKLAAAKLQNEDQVLQSLELERDEKHSPKDWKMPNPYWPRTTKLKKFLNEVEEHVETRLSLKRYKVHKKKKNVSFYHQPRVHEWMNKEKRGEDTKACAVKWLDDQKINYELHTIDLSQKNIHEWRKQGFILTHFNHCGACSSLHDLHVYETKRDLTEPARKCFKKMGLKKIKRCYQKEIGFSEVCAELWAYNSQNTKKACLGICIKDYGLGNLLLGRFNDTYTEDDGKTLKPCIGCDEQRSVPGYAYGAGRTRRNSGIESGIQRREGELDVVDHSRYFEGKKNFRYFPTLDGAKNKSSQQN